METLNAVVEEDNGKRFIKIVENTNIIKIPMTEDRPNEVKSAFNKLIARIKDGEFQIKLEPVGEDLFSQVANEYILQLNKEIEAVRAEMVNYGLVNADVDV